MNDAYVVDASVVVKWYLSEEDAVDKAAPLYDAFYTGQVSLYAPPLIMHEVPRSFHRAVRQHRINLDTALEYVSRFTQIQLTIVDRRDTLSSAMRIAEEYCCNLLRRLLPGTGRSARPSVCLRR